MASARKTERTLATIRVADLATKLQVDVRAVYYQLKRLHITPHHGPGRRVMVNPTQAALIEQHLRTGRAALQVVGTGILVDKDRAKMLIGALEGGATKIQLVIQHDASLEESDAAYQWWQREKNSFVLPPHVVETLVASVGKFDTAENLLLAIEEVLTSARSCAQCGTKVKTVMCSTCTPKPARPGPKPLMTTEQKPVGPDPIEEAKFKEIAKRLGLNDRADSYGPDSFTPLEDSK